MKNITKLALGLILFFALSTKAFAQPANDQCTGATSVTPNGSCVAGTTVAATDNWTGTVGCQAGGGTHEDVWYTFVSTGTIYTGTLTSAAPWTGNVEFTLVSSATGCAGPFTIVGSACGASPLSISIPGLTNGATYYFTISPTSAGNPGPFTICSTTSSPAANCVDNEDCSTPQVVAWTTGVQTCIADCNTGAAAGPDFAGNNCFDFPNSTVWYQVTTGASSASIDIALTSAVMTAPYFSVFTTSNCLTYTTINCTQGAAGSASANVLIAANTTYLIAVSNNGAATGAFNLCITVNDDNSACNTTNSLTVSATSMGSPLTGPYQPGEIVTFCYNITDFQQFNCNYLQGIVPSFGNCWDPVSFNAQGMPVNIPTPLTTAGVIQPCGVGPPCAWAACVGTPSGTWSWFPAGAVTYNAIAGSLPAGSAMPAGWYFLSSYNPATGACTGGDPVDPDNSYGDGSFPACGTNTLDWNVCFKLQALGAIACTNGTTNCSVTIHTYADGEIGIWNNVGCTGDASGAASFASNLCCTAAPTVTTPVTYCIGTAASQLTATGSGLLWYTVATGGVGSATAPTPSTAATGSTNYYVSSTSGGCESARTIITVTVTPLPVATFSYTGTPYCQTAANPSPTFSGGGIAGTFSASAAGLVFVSTSTGQVNLSGSTPGTYTVTNSIAATSTCSAVSATSTITITPVPVATFSYTGTPYCKNAANPSPTFSGGGVAGTFSASAGGLVFVSTATGQVNLSASTAGTYTVTNTIAAAGGCAAVTATSTITITPLPVATFSYTGTPYCKNAANPSPTFSGGGVAGTFSASAGGLVFVSTATGQVNLSASTAGTYTVTNTIAAAGGCPAVTATSTITITPLPVATFSYTGSPYCQTGVNPSPTFSGGGVAGTFSASSAGLVFVSTATGQVNLSASTTGTYTVTNTIAAASGCPAVTATATITINLDNASFSYASSTYCQTGTNPTPTITGLAGGTFTSTPGGLSLNAATGLITLSTSGLNTYTVTYTTNGTCPNSATFNVTVTTAPAATFSYAGPYCQGGAPNPSPTYSGGGSAGTFTASAGGLVFVSTSTGQINLATSTPGTYTVTNTIAAAGGCSAASATSSVTINPAPVATFSYTATPYCQNAANPSPAFSGGGVAGTFSASAAGLVFVSTATGQVNLSASTAGTYTVTNTIAAASGCSTVTATSTITITPLPVATFSYTATPYCQNAANPSPTFSGGGVAGTFSASAGGLVFVSTATGQVNLIGSTAGTYTVTNTIAAASGCPAVTATSTITITPLPVATFSYTGTPYCQNAANPSPTFSGGGVAGTFSASAAGLVFISTATGQVNLSGSTAGTYTVTNTIAAASGCPAVTATATIIIIPMPVFTVTSTNPTTCGGTDGTITLSGLIASTSYNIAYLNGATIVGPTSMTSDASGNIVITGLSQGSYSGITVDISGCSTTDPGTYTLSDPAPPTFTVTSTNPTTCGGSDGTITLSGLTASTSYNITYSNGATVVGPTAMTSDASGNIIITGLSQGSYTAITVSLSGCNTVDAGTYTLTDPAPPTFTVTSTNPTICGASDGTITLSGLTASTSYNVTYSNGATVVGPTAMTSDASGNIVITGLPQGSYTSITVSLSGCNAVDPGTYTLTDPSAPTFIVASTNPTTCGGTDGTITLSGLTASTSYNITYSNGATVVGPTAMTSDASGNIILTGLSQGSYSSIIADLSGCSSTNAGPYVLTDPAAPTFTVTSSNPTTCGGSDGTITLSGLTASTSYNVTYSNGATVVGPTAMTSDASGNIIITGLSQGSYTAITVSLSGCNTVDAGTYTLTDPSAPTFTVASTNPTICGAADGTITLSGLTASTSYNVTYSNGATVVGPTAMTSDASGNIIITGLSQGSYSAITVSLSGCNTVDAGTYTLTDPSAPTFTVASTDPTICGGADGTITLSGLTASTSYNVTYTNGATVVGPAGMTSDGAGSIIISGLSAGTYTNIIVGTTGCISTNAGPYVLTDPAAPTFTVASANPTICGAVDGTITLSGLIAGTNYNVTYTNGATVVGPTAMTADASGNIIITGLSQGSYSNIIVGTPGCTATNAGPYILTDPAPQTFTVTPADPTVCGGSDGTITLSGLTAGTIYNVAYFNGAALVGPVSMTADASGNIVITGLSPGSYSNIAAGTSVTCASVMAGPYILTSPLPPVAPSATGATYCQNATISPIVANGTGGTYNWYDDAGLSIFLASGPTFTPSTTTTHTYYVTETMGTCQSPATAVTITINPAPDANAGSTQVLNCVATSVNLSGTSLSSGVTYLWSGPGVIAGGSTLTPTVNAAGTYTLTVSDASSCTSTSIVTVTQTPDPIASFTANPESGTRPLTVDFTNTSQNSNTYVWNFGDGSPDASTINATEIYNTAGTFTVTLTASYNSQCPNSAEMTIIVLEDFTIMIPNVFTPNGDANNDVFKAISTGIETLEGAVYDRWGLKIFEWSGVNDGWDGRTSSGVESADGTYYYVLNIKGRDVPAKIYTGYVQLVR